MLFLICSVQAAMRLLPKMEPLLIEERYMCSESEYLTDYNVYCHKFHTGQSCGIEQRFVGKHSTGRP